MEYIIPPQAVEAKVRVWCTTKKENYFLSIDVLSFFVTKTLIVDCRCGKEILNITKKVVLDVKIKSKDSV